MREPIHMNDVLEHVIAEGYADESIYDLAEQTLQSDKNSTAWYIQALMGCGGWFAALMFFSCSWFFFIDIDLSDDRLAFASIFLGIVFLIITTVVRRSVNLPILLAQFSLVFQLAGHLLILFGVVTLMDFQMQNNLTIISLVMIILQVIMLPLFPDDIFRFVSTLAIVAALTIIIYDVPIVYGFSVLTGVLTLLTMLTWGDLLPPAFQIVYRPILNPVRYAIPSGMFAMLIVEQVETYQDFVTPYSSAILTALLILGLITWAQVRLLKEYDVPLMSSVTLAIFGVTLIAFLPAITTPGILAALLVILLGYRQRNALLLGFAYAFLAGFIVYFYFNLDTTLLIKSFIMMGTGILLLIAWFLFRRMVVIQEKSSEVIA